jgi:hypothetical protein
MKYGRGADVSRGVDVFPGSLGALLASRYLAIYDTHLENRPDGVNHAAHRHSRARTRRL